MYGLMDSSLETALVQAKRIPLVERQDDRFLDELAFPIKAKGFVEPNTGARTGHMIAAKYYLATRVLRYSANASDDHRPDGDDDYSTIIPTCENSVRVRPEPTIRHFEMCRS